MIDKRRRIDVFPIWQVTNTDASSRMRRRAACAFIQARWRNQSQRVMQAGIKEDPERQTHAAYRGRSSQSKHGRNDVDLLEALLVSVDILLKGPYTYIVLNLGALPAVCISCGRRYVAALIDECYVESLHHVIPCQVLLLFHVCFSFAANRNRCVGPCHI